MNEGELDVLLGRAAERVPVAPPRVHEMLRQERRGRQRSWAVGLAAAVAVVAVASGGVWLQAQNAPGPEGTVAGAGVPQLPPAKGQWVGLGEIAIDLPADWKADQLRCGAPVANTWTIDSGVGDQRACYGPWGDDVTSVTFTRLTNEGASDAAGDVDTEEYGGHVQIDGRTAGRMDTRCNLDEAASDFCSGNLFFAEEEVFVAVSSNRGAKAVDDVLATARVFPGFTGVPGSRGLTVGQYKEALTAAGLELDFDLDAVDTQMVRSVEPAAGTMLPRGSAVTVAFWE